MKTETQHPHTLLEKGKKFDAMKEQRDELLQTLARIQLSTTDKWIKDECIKAIKATKNE